MDKEKTGLLIRDARKKKNYTQSELGYMLGVTNKAISRWENGDSFPDIGVLEELSRLLDLKIQDLVTGEIQNDDGPDDRKSHDEKAITEIVRLAKVQLHEKRKKLFRDIVFIGAFICAVVVGIIGFRVSGTFHEQLSGVLCFILLAITLGIVVYEGNTYGKETVKKRSIACYVRIIATVCFIWSVVIMLLISVTTSNGIIPFGMELGSAGPFAATHLIIFLIICTALMVMELYRWVKGTGAVHEGYILSVSTIYLCALYADLLGSLSSTDRFFILLAERTAVVILEVVIALFVSKRLDKNKSNQSADREKAGTD